MLIARDHPEATRQQRLLLVAVVLMLVTIGLYWPVRHHKFVDFDDYSYVAANTHVMYGLSWDSIVWAFTQSHSANWHPITWISHMIDVQLFGLNPGPHHVVNVLFHAVNGALLFLLLQRLTGAFWRPAFVAAFFAWHPLHVESVAWVAERKDVLSLFFFLLTLLAYGEYVRQGGRKWYVASLIAFLLGLMSKSMLVTTPCVLLLLDYWPLGRMSGAEGKGADWQALLKEKVPFFALTIVCSLIALHTQGEHGAIMGTDELPVDVRILNSFMSVVRYLGKMAWPAGLTAFYPYQQWDVWKPIVAALAIVAGCAAAFRWRREQPWVFTGWFWFLGTLVPVIGLVQVGQQAIADRYTYLPSIGAAMALAWLVTDWVNCQPQWRAVVIGGATVSLGALAVSTRLLVPVWQDTASLFGRAVAVTPNSPLALLNLGYALKTQGRDAEAKQYLLRALQISPNIEEVHYNLANIYLKEGDVKQAEEHFLAAAKLNPGRAETFNHLANIHLGKGDSAGALALYDQAVKVNPQDGKSQHNYAVVLAEAGRLKEAIQHYEAALPYLADTGETQVGLGMALARTGQLPAAEAHFREALRSSKPPLEALRGLGGVLSMQGRLTEAEPLARRCIEASPNNPVYQLDYAMVLVGLKRYPEAVPHLRTSLQLRADWVPAMEKLAWLLATAPEDALRNGPEAVKLAERAVQLSNRQMLQALDTLGAAYAETGRFPDALAAVEEALKLASKLNSPPLTASLNEHAEAYRRQKPWRESR